MIAKKESLKDILSQKTTFTGNDVTKVAVCRIKKIKEAAMKASLL